MIYEITGVDIYGKRFKIVTTNPIHAQGINLYRGTKWQRETPSSPRKLIQRVWN